MKMNEKTVNLEELLKGIVESGGKVPVSSIRVLVKKIPVTQGEKPVCNQPADEPMPVKSMPVKPATDKPTTGCKDEPANSGKDMPICIHIDNVHIHMDESVTSNYGPGALAGISSDDDDIDDEAFDEENCHGSCDHCGEEEDGLRRMATMPKGCKTSRRSSENTISLPGRDRRKVEKRPPWFSM